MVNYAHRGASSYAPENTLPAFNLGIEMGADGIETDIRRTKDGILVLFHDDTLERVAGVGKAVEELTYKELMEYDLGIWKGEQYRGTRIVRLDDFLSEYGTRLGMHLALEIKGKGIALDAYDEIISHAGMTYEITSFSYESILEIRKAHLEPKLGYLTSNFSHDEIKRLVDDGMNEICPRADLITPSLTAYAHEKGLRVRAWGVKDMDLMIHASLSGVDGMTVNFPDLLTAYLRRNNEGKNI